MVAQTGSGWSRLRRGGSTGFWTSKTVFATLEDPAATLSSRMSPEQLEFPWVSTGRTWMSYRMARTCSDLLVTIGMEYVTEGICATPTTALNNVTRVRINGIRQNGKWVQKDFRLPSAVPDHGKLLWYDVLDLKVGIEVKPQCRVCNE